MMYCVYVWVEGSFKCLNVRKYSIGVLPMVKIY